MIAAAERYVGIDLLRVVAGGSLLVAHSAQWLAALGLPDSTWQVAASLAVEVFLVSFGFLMGMRVLGGARRTGLHLLVRQALRLWPLYALAVCANLAFVELLNLPQPSLPAYLSLSQNLAWRHPPFFPEAWIVAAALAGCVMITIGLAGWQPGRRIGSMRIVWLLLLIGISHLPRAAATVAADPDWDLAIRKIILVRLDPVLYGLLAAAILHRFRSIRSCHRAWAAGAGVVALIAAATLMADGALATTARAPLYWFSGVDLGVALLLPWLCCVETTTRVSRIAATLASCAFAGLLSHMTLLRFGYWLGAPMQAGTAIDGIVLQAAYVLIATSVAWLLWRLLDAPWCRLLPGVAARPRPPPVVER